MGDAFGEETERGPCAAMSTRPGPAGVCVPAVARRRSRGNQASRERLGKTAAPGGRKEENLVQKAVLLLSCFAHR